MNRIVKRILLAPLVIVATIIVLLDDLFRSFVKPAVAALATLRPIAALERAIAALPAYIILTLFLIPMAIIEPVKLYALYLIEQGHWVWGALVFALLKIVGIGLAERLFAIGKPKLLSIRWFAWCYGVYERIRDRVYAFLDQFAWWRAAKQIVASLRSGLAFVRQFGVRASLTLVWARVVLFFHGLRGRFR